MTLRLVAAFLPLALLWIPKLIIDLVVRAIRYQSIDKLLILKLIIVEFMLAVVSDALSRFITLVDSLLGDKFTNHVSIRLMQHANSLDLVSFEDPVFYDKLERARRQTTTRLGMLAMLAGMVQQFITLLTMISAVVFYSPWLLLLLIGSTIPVFLGETKFALLNYSILFRYTPERRELDYLRYLGASNESAKEVKIFGLGQYLVDRAQALFNRFYNENASLAVRRAVHGVLIGLLPTSAYYGAYTYVVWRALAGALSVGDLTLVVGAF
jgi:ATP-binding cassette subfamily B protein